jgi:hypothetical protein
MIPRAVTLYRIILDRFLASADSSVIIDELHRALKEERDDVFHAIRSALTRAKDDVSDKGHKAGIAIAQRQVQKVWDERERKVGT